MPINAIMEWSESPNIRKDQKLEENSTKNIESNFDTGWCYSEECSPCV